MSPSSSLVTLLRLQSWKGAPANCQVKQGCCILASHGQHFFSIDCDPGVELILEPTQTSMQRPLTTTSPTRKYPAKPLIQWAQKTIAMFGSFGAVAK